MKTRLSVRRDDKVKIIIGKDRGKTGKVTQVLPNEQMVVVEGLNVRIKNVRARREGEKGQRIEFHAPMHVSNVMVVCPKCGKPTRVRHRAGGGDAKTAKVRVCAKCNEVLTSGT